MANRSLYGHYLFASLFLNALNGHLYHLLSLSLSPPFPSFFLYLWLHCSPGYSLKTMPLFPCWLHPALGDLLFPSCSLVLAKVPCHGQDAERKVRYFMSKGYFMKCDITRIESWARAMEYYLCDFLQSVIFFPVLSILKAGSQWAENVKCRADN